MQTVTTTERTKTMCALESRHGKLMSILNIFSKFL